MRILAVVSDEGRLAPVDDWHGVEYWPSLAAVRDSLWRRVSSFPGFVTVHYADGGTSPRAGYYLSEYAEILVYACPDELTEDTVTDAVFGPGAYPLCRFVLGPRGGISKQPV